MHMSVSRDLPFTWQPKDLMALWKDNATSYSLPENSDLTLNLQDIIL